MSQPVLSFHFGVGEVVESALNSLKFFTGLTSDELAGKDEVRRFFRHLSEGKADRLFILARNPDFAIHGQLRDGKVTFLAYPVRTFERK